jgi:SAM-dependent methyltransferase
MDIRQEMLDHIAKRLEAEKLTNVKLVLVKPDDPMLPVGGADTILLVDTLHYVQDRAAYARKLRAGLAPGGRVVIIDYIPKPWSERPWGPAPEQQFSREQIDADMAAAGLVPIKIHEFLTEQYFVEYGVPPSKGGKP